MRGRNLSTGSGAEARRGGQTLLLLYQISIALNPCFGLQVDKSQGLGDRVPKMVLIKR
jgi:hypothetical protein